MKLSLRGEYALRALIVLGQNYSESVVRIQSISRQQHIPQRFLEQILNELKAGGFVESKRGVAGGYRLARPPEDIRLEPVIRHMQGALAPLSSAGRRNVQPRSGPNEATCAIRSVMQEVHEAIARILDQVTVADLCERARQFSSELEANPDYVI